MHANVQGDHLQDQPHPLRPQPTICPSALLTRLTMCDGAPGEGRENQLSEDFSLRPSVFKSVGEKSQFALRFMHFSFPPRIFLFCPKYPKRLPTRTAKNADWKRKSPWNAEKAKLPRLKDVFSPPFSLRVDYLNHV